MLFEILTLANSDPPYIFRTETNYFHTLFEKKGSKSFDFMMLNKLLVLIIIYMPVTKVASAINT